MSGNQFAHGQVRGRERAVIGERRYVVKREDCAMSSLRTATARPDVEGELKPGCGEGLDADLLDFVVCIHDLVPHLEEHAEGGVSLLSSHEYGFKVVSFACVQVFDSG